MRQKLLTIDDVFKIAGRGIVITGNQPEVLPEFKIGNPIVLVLPDGREIMTKISGFDLFNVAKGSAILIENIAKEDVPIGTEVFLHD